MYRAIVLALLVPATAAARARNLSYARESDVPAPGSAELQLWTTDRTGRTERFTQFDNRFELELGLTETLMTAFYLNAATSVQGDGAERRSSSGFTGISSEWKYQLARPERGLGAALFGEATYGPETLGFKAKLILDGGGPSWLWAGNLTGDQTWNDLGGADVPVQTGELNLGAAGRLGEHVTLGGELWAFYLRNDGESEGVTAFVGPTLGLKVAAIWVATSVLVQATSFGGGRDGYAADLDRRERISARVLLGREL